jgi:RNA polymerase sigma-70 factor (ECF subfamily)
LAAALLTLSEDMRETVYYVAVLGMKCREEAELMGVPAGTLLSRIHRIRTNLRRSLGMDARDPDRGHAA